MKKLSILMVLLILLTLTTINSYAVDFDFVTADEVSLERGAELYATNCASCHGDGGMGDGPIGAALDPAPSPLSH